MFKQDDSGRVRTPLEPVILAATLALIPVLIVESYGTGAWYTAAEIANWLIWGLFALELVVILTVAERKLDALRAHWLDVAVTVVTLPLFGKFLSSLRLVRLARLLRLLRVGTILARAIQAERRLTSTTVFRLVALITVFIVAVAGAAEATFDSHDFPSIWDGVWWAVVTVTTVGYGDLYPKDVTGRVIGIAVMFVGIGFLSVLTATVASYFVKIDSGSDTDDVAQALARIEQELKELRALVAVDSK